MEEEVAAWSYRGNAWLIEIHLRNKIKNVRFRTRCARCSILIRGSNGYAGRDPQGGTSDRSV